MTNEELYRDQLYAVMSHIEESQHIFAYQHEDDPDLVLRHGKLWWMGDWPADIDLAAKDMAQNEGSYWWDVLPSLLDNYIADLKGCNMGSRLETLRETIGEAGCDIFGSVSTYLERETKDDKSI